ncbi:MAG: hypothetical protein IPP93_17220 [Chitinophagaceae bacterium]|nr:hypothetical protein [Chitinophagaceae bacterium]
MKKYLFTKIFLGMLVLFVVGGCSIEYRTQREHRRNSPEYNQRHKRHNHRHSEIRIDVNDRHK